MSSFQQPAIPTNLELLSQQAVEGFIIGLHKSPFHGFSVEFAEHRLYNQGDPIRHIDWKVFGRTDKLFVKRYEEETNLRCCIVLDTSSSMNFKHEITHQSKLQFSCLAAASLIQLLKKQLDAAALNLFDENSYFFSDCRSTGSHYKYLINELQKIYDQPTVQKKSNLPAILHNVAEKMHKRSLILILTDGLDDEQNEEALFNSLQHLRFNKHEVVFFQILEHQKEMLFEFENRPYQFVNMETGETTKLQPEQIKAAYQQQINQYVKELKSKCLQYQIEFVPVDLTLSVNQVLHTFLYKRHRMTK